MTNTQQLLLYGTAVILAAMAGGSIPLWSRHSVRRLEYFLAASAGVMLGVIAGHMLPEAFESGGAPVAWAVVGGFIFLLLVERFVLPHALHAPSASEAHAHCDPAEEQEHVRRDAAGIGAFLGLGLHTIVDGIALGAALDEPKVARFVALAIIVHKIPSAFALGSILVRAGARARTVLVATAALGAMVGLGAVLFLATRAFGRFDTAAWTPYAVAFSAGSFLHVAVTDLLPDLHRRGVERTGLVVALLGGLALMIGLSQIVPD